MTATATASSNVSVTGLLDKNQFLLRRLHSLTGIIFGGYVCVHLLINATLLEGTRGVEGGATIYQLQVDKIHSLPLLVAIEWAAIYLPLLFHTLYGIYVIGGGRWNNGDYGYAKNWLYTLQRISAIILVLFIAFHVLTMKGVFGGEFGRELTFVPHEHATQSAVNHMHAAWWIGWVLYPIGILAGTFHLANGFWTAAITWGLTISKEAQQKWGAVCIGIFVVTTLSGFGALAATLREEPRDLGSLQNEYHDPAAGAPLAPSAVIEGAADTVKNAD